MKKILTIQILILSGLLTTAQAAAIDKKILPAETTKFRTAAYYVDATLGSDSNDGLSQETPWKTVAKVNTVYFNPGDRILFKKGETWHEQLSITRSGYEDMPITYGAYDPSVDTRSKRANRLPAPVISGANVIDPASWVKHSANIYVANVGAITPPNQLYVDNSFYDIAHYPNNGFLTATHTAPDQRHLIDTSLVLPPNTDINGATMITKSMPWTLDANWIASFDPATGTIHTPHDIRYVMNAGWGYYLRNKLWMLDAPNEWFYDQQAGKLYLWVATGDNPAKRQIAVSQREIGINVNSASYITITGINVVHAANINVAISGESSNNVNLENISSAGSRYAVYMNCNNCTLKGSKIASALVNAVTATGDDIVILGNSITDTGNVGITPDVTPFSIVITGNNSIVKNNELIDNGYVGIGFNGSHQLIQNNTITNFCLKLGDCGGIYTWALDENNTQVGTVVDGNIVANAAVVLDGVPYETAPWLKEQGEGIYLDDRRHHITVTNNTILNVSKGIFVHNGHNNVIRGNKVYGAREYAFALQQDWVSAGYVRDNIIEDNYFHSLNTGAGYMNYSEDRTDFGIMNNNRYCLPAEEKTVARYTPPSGVNHLHLQLWQKISEGQDSNSVVLPSGCNEEAQKFYKSVMNLDRESL